MNRYIRKTSPQIVLKLWQIFESSHSSEEELIRQLTEKLSPLFPKNTFEEEEEVLRQIIGNALEDKLLVVDGSDSENKLMRIKPSFNRLSFGTLTNDWYCFECHSSDQNCPLIDCKTCFRAFHQKCLKWDQTSDEFQCDYCLNANQMDSSLKINRLDRISMNRMFGLVLNQFENSIEDFDFYTEYELGVNQMSNVLIYSYLDLKTIELKVKSNSYKNISEFENDFKHFVHNFMVYRIEGLDGNFETFLGHHIQYLKSCSDCYNYGHNQEFRNVDEPHEWFTRVCDPPHPLVYAKCEGRRNLPFWPSKVIRLLPDDKCLVQFFESPHFECSEVPVMTTKPIDYIFAIKKFRNNNKIRESLAMVSTHMNKLIALGLGHINQYQNALNFFERYKLSEPYDPNKRRVCSQPALKSKKPKITHKVVDKNAISIKSSQQKPKKQKSKPINTQKDLETNFELMQINETQVEDNSDDDSDESDIQMKEDEALNEIFGDIEEFEETTFDTPLNDFLQSDRYSEQMKWELCQHIIKRSIFRLKQSKQQSNNK